jgi:FkbM family methyltransferase
LRWCFDTRINARRLQKVAGSASRHVGRVPTPFPSGEPPRSRRRTGDPLLGAASISRRAKTWARRAGFDVQRYTPARSIDARRARILERLGVTLLLDVGSHSGQYARLIRAAGYRGKIVSFEPLSGPFSELLNSARVDPLWECHRVALGNEEGQRELHVSRTSASSSFLRMGDEHLRAAPGSAYLGTENVAVTRLDTIARDVVSPNATTFLKIDVQGYEMEVLLGATRLLPSVVGIEVELSVVPLYENQPLFREVIDCLDTFGFTFVGVDPGLTDPTTGHMLQMDGIFVRTG